MTPLILSLVLSASIGLPATYFIRGDCTGDGAVNNSDGYAILDWVFNGVDLDCFDAGDFNDSGTVTQADYYALMSFAYQGGPQPPNPWPDCGTDTSSDSLDCDEHVYCN